MAIMRMAAFGGMQPIVDPTLIPDNGGVLSQNAWLYSGAAIGLPIPQDIHTLSRSDIGKVYRIPQSYVSPTELAESTWMEFPNFDTDVVRSPTFGEKWDRYYWASINGPPRYSTREMIDDGDPPWLLGIPTPDVAPKIKLTSDGDSGIPISRAYVYTYVSEYGEEGAPSPPTLKTTDAGNIWKITCFNPTSSQKAERNLTHYRIYRTVTSTSGIPNYYLVAELQLPVSEFEDHISDQKLTANTVLESTSWTPPPEDLAGFCMMPNGILAGWRGSEMWFSEPYRPHAWPALYVQLTEYPIVGMGIWNQTLVVCTQGFPVVAFGTTPAAIVTSKLTLFEPCMSRGSILSTPEGVYYTSPTGLVLVSDSAQVVTSKLISKDQWQQLQRRVSFRAARLGEAYYGWGAVTSGAFQVNAFKTDSFQQTDETGARDGFYLDLTDPRVALNTLKSDKPVYGVQNDVWSGEVYILRDGKVQLLNQSDASILTEPVVWTSKLFSATEPRNYAVMKVYFTVPPGTPAPPATRDTELVQTLGSKWGIVRFFCDEGELICTHELRQSGELMRLPGDRKYEFCQVQYEGRVRLRSIVVASTAKELAGV